MRLGLSPFQDTILPALGVAKGWYKDEGVDVEIRVLGWTEIQEALTSGAVDMLVRFVLYGLGKLTPAIREAF